MVLVCKDEAELDQMMNIINNQMGWKADCSFCSDDGNDISWFIDSTSGGAEIDFFKADYKAAKKQLQHNRPGER